MKDIVLLIAANPYRIVDENTAEVTEGISIAYCMTPDVLPKTEERDGKVVFYGHRVLKGSVPVDNRKELTQVPAFYEAEFDIKPGANGKAELKPKSLKFKKSVV